MCCIVVDGFWKAKDFFVLDSLQKKFKRLGLFQFAGAMMYVLHEVLGLTEDKMIVPSEWYENKPMTIIESYSVGTPVIGARIGGIPEIVVENKTGYQFASGDSEELKDKVLLADG